MFPSCQETTIMTKPLAFLEPIETLPSAIPALVVGTLIPNLFIRCFNEIIAPKQVFTLDYPIERLKTQPYLNAIENFLASSSCYDYLHQLMRKLPIQSLSAFCEAIRQQLNKVLSSPINLHTMEKTKLAYLIASAKNCATHHVILFFQYHYQCALQGITPFTAIYAPTIENNTELFSKTLRAHINHLLKTQQLADAMKNLDGISRVLLISRLNRQLISMHACFSFPCFQQLEQQIKAFNIAQSYERALPFSPYSQEKMYRNNKLQAQEHELSVASTL